MKRILTSVLTLALVSSTLAGCGQSVKSPNSTPQDKSPASKSQQTLSVLYAGSMTKVMEQSISSSFNKESGYQFQGEGKGSSALSKMIRDGIRNPDIFISASPSVNTKDLMGDKNHNLAKWFLTLASDQMVIAYNPKSRFANQLKDAAAGKIPWYTVLGQSGFRFGRTDPVLDPKGVNTIFMMELAGKYYHDPALQQKVLGDADNTQQIFPEEDLLAHLETGQIDAIAAYKHEAIERKLPYIELPAEVNLSDTQLKDLYQSVSYKTKKGEVKVGAPVVFTITIPTTVHNKAGAEAFVKYMTVGKGHDQLLKDGFTQMPVLLYGAQTELPESLRSLVQGEWKEKEK